VGVFEATDPDELELDHDAPRLVPDADLRGLAALVLVGSAGLTIEMFLARWGIEQPGPTPLGLALGLWVLSPYALLGALARRAAPNADRAALHFGGCLLIGAFGVVACYYGLYRDPGAQEGMIPLLVPLWQWVGATGLAAGLRVLPD